MILPVLALVCSHPAHGQSYQITDLGTPDGPYSYTAPHAINQAASVAGEWGGGSSQNAFLYSNGTIVSIANNAIAYAVNNSNAVVGDAGSGHAFLCTNGTMTDLGAYGGSYSIAWALNDSGQIVGESTVSALPNAQDHAVWWQSGGILDLGVLPTGDYSSARGINDSNVIVGESSSITGTVTNIYAFIYSNGVMNAVGTLPGGNYSSARAINNSGQFVGEASITNGDTHAFLFSRGAMLDLGTFGGNYSTAAAINNSGLVVGYSYTTSNNLQRAFLFNGSATFDLNDLISQPSVCTNLISGDGINDAGQITGSGYTPTGQYHAFLLTPVFLLSLPVVLANGHFSVTVNGVPGQRFALEVSANLTNWAPVRTNTLFSGSLVYTNSSAANSPRQFYRALLLP